MDGDEVEYLKRLAQNDAALLRAPTTPPIQGSYTIRVGYPLFLNTQHFIETFRPNVSTTGKEKGVTQAEVVSNADIITIAMLKMHDVWQNYQARLLLQVHDKLSCEVPPKEWKESPPTIKSTIESAVELSALLVVGSCWTELDGS